MYDYSADDNSRTNVGLPRDSVQTEILKPKKDKKKKKKQQSKLACFLESFSNEAVGYVINTTVQILIFPLMGVHLSLAVNMASSGIHSFFGVTRIYALRRLFGRLGRKQSKLSSLAESITNIAVGTFISFFVTLYIYPLVGANVSTTDTFGITLMYLTITLTRLYLLRRIFNNKLEARRKAKKVLKKALKQQDKNFFLSK